MCECVLRDVCSLSPGVVCAVESEFDALAAKKDMTRAGEEPRLRVARSVGGQHTWEGRLVWCLGGERGGLVYMWNSPAAHEGY